MNREYPLTIDYSNGRAATIQQDILAGLAWLRTPEGQSRQRATISYPIGDQENAQLILTATQKILLGLDTDGTMLHPLTRNSLTVDTYNPPYGAEPLVAHEMKHIHKAAQLGVNLADSRLDIELAQDDTDHLQLSVYFLPPATTDPFDLIYIALAVDQLSESDIGCIVNQLRSHPELFTQHLEFLSEIQMILKSKPAFYRSNPYNNPLLQATHDITTAYQTLLDTTKR